MPDHITIERRQPLLQPPNPSSKPKNRRRSKVGEAAGDCAAVWCCFPCAAVHLVILAVYRVPIGIWRKKKRNRLLKKKRKENEMRRNGDEEESTDGEEDCVVGSVNDVVEWEKEMMDRFYGAGFWRSGSQRTDSDG